MAISDSQLRRFASFIPATESVVNDLAAARAIMLARLDSYVPGTIPAATSDQIEIRLAAYFAYTRLGQGLIESESIDGVSSISYENPAINYWQQAVLLDPTGTLLAVGGHDVILAEIHVGGLSKSVKSDALSDSDLVQPKFVRDQDRYWDDLYGWGR